MSVLSRFRRAWTGPQSVLRRHFFILSLSWCSVWASKHPLQTNLFRIPPKSFTGWRLGTYGGFCFSWHIRDVELVEQGSSWKCVMSTCKVWQEQNFVLSIYFINEGLQANSWSPRTLGPVSSQAPQHGHMILEEASCWQKQGAWQLFFHFLASFLTFLHTLTGQSSLNTFFWDTQRKKVLNNCTFTQRLVRLSSKIQWSPLFQGKVFHDWSTWHLDGNKIASCCLGTLELKDNYYQPKRFEK